MLATKVVHITCFGVASKTEENLVEWEKRCKKNGWELRSWGLADAEKLILEQKSDLVDLWSNLSHVQQRLDVISYLIVYTHGGMTVPCYCSPQNNALPLLEEEVQKLSEYKGPNQMVVFGLNESDAPEGKSEKQWFAFPQTENEDTDALRVILLENSVFWALQPKNTLLKRLLQNVAQSKTVCPKNHDWCAVEPTGILMFSRTVGLYQNKTAKSICILDSRILRDKIFNEFCPWSLMEAKVVAPKVSVVYTRWKYWIAQYEKKKKPLVFVGALIITLGLLLVLSKVHQHDKAA